MSEQRPKRRGRLFALLAVNASMLVGLGVVTFAPDAHAQSRGRGAYTMIAGGANGSSSSVVYIVDTANDELIAVRYDANARQLNGVGYRNLMQDLMNASSGQGR